MPGICWLTPHHALPAYAYHQTTATRRRASTLPRDDIVPSRGVWRANMPAHLSPHFARLLRALPCCLYASYRRTFAPPPRSTSRRRHIRCYQHDAPYGIAGSATLLLCILRYRAHRASAVRNISARLPYPYDAATPPTVPCTSTSPRRRLPSPLSG